MYGIPFEPKVDNVEVEEVPIKYEYENNIVVPFDDMTGTNVKCNFSKHGLNMSYCQAGTAHVINDT